MFGKKEGNMNAPKSDKIKEQVLAKEVEENVDEKVESNEVEDKETDKVKLLQEENEKLKESLMRTLAELDNTRRRSVEENEKTAKYAIGKFAEDLIPVMENMYLAFDSVKDNNFDGNKEAKNFFEGVRLTHNELKKAFERSGVVRIFPMDDEFDPELHDAITQVESDKPEGMIVQVMQAGYKIKDRLLRPAMVGVAKSRC